MPSNQTPNYKLNQWSKSDRIQMEDFNADNAKLDAAIKAEATARASAVSTLNSKIAKCGNCKIALTSYIGKGPDAGPTIISFPSRPLFVLISGEQGICTFAGSAAKGGSIAVGETTSQPFVHTVALTWTGNTVSIAGANVRCRMNSLNYTYYVVALYAMD